MSLKANDKDTICAISTPPGHGAIGIVRLTGPLSVGILSNLFVSNSNIVGDNFKSHRIYYGHVVNPRDKEVVDEVLVNVMLAPRTYTREDVVEINCHGGPAAVRSVLELCMRLGARLAEPGEFTKRAFLNGRIDLTKAEAVMDVISSTSEISLKAAMGQLKGALGDRIRRLRDGLVELKALTELSIDFVEEDVDYVSADGLVERASMLVTEIDGLVSTYDEGRVLREGMRLVIAGLPNVGKSSLMNRLLDEERAIVTEIPGTTRDTVEETTSIAGVPVRLIDTAGVRESEDAVERAGVERTEAAIRDADIVLFMLDGSRDVSDGDRELSQKLSSKKTVTVINKTDIGEDVSAEDASSLCESEAVVRVSAKRGDGVDGLKTCIRDTVLGHGGGSATDVTVSLRHKNALERAVASLRRFEDGVRDGLSQEFLALELQDALDALGEIVGETTPDDVLDVIFSRFCIGK